MDSSNKITISVDLVCPDQTVLIISHPSGIFYEAQCGGVGCLHLTYEGFVISLGSFMENFDDCKYGCYNIPEMIESRNNLAMNLDVAFQKHRSDYAIRFDFDRIDQLTEGWWPVVVSGEIDHWNHLKGEFKGIIHIGNCD